MVTKWGMSDKLGPLAYSEESGEVFLGKSVTQTKNVSDETAYAIDGEIRMVIESNYARAKKIIEDNLDKLHAMSAALMKYETIDSDQIRRIMAGQEPGAPESWTDGGGASGGAARPSSDKGAGPVVTPKPASQT
jgi:cell division protease FtsH